MPKVKVPRKSVSLDMTAMCDMAFLLLTFFMLTTKFKPQEALTVDIPPSVSQIPIPDKDMLLISVRDDGAVFFGVDDQNTRGNMLKTITEKYKIAFTPKEQHEFLLLENFGVPVQKLKSLLAVEGPDRNRVKQDGVPTDSLNNQLSDWIYAARYANPKIRIAIKGDKKSNYEVVKDIIGTLQDQNINRFNLVTSVKNLPKD